MPFANEGVEVDLKLTKQIEMIPFGVGWRMCGGLVLDVWHKTCLGIRVGMQACETVDLSEAEIITVVMKYPSQSS